MKATVVIQSLRTPSLGFCFVVDVDSLPLAPDKVDVDGFVIFEERVCRDKVEVVDCFCFRIPGLLVPPVLTAGVVEEEEDLKFSLLSSMLSMSLSRGISNVGVGFRDGRRVLLVLLLSGWRIEDLSFEEPEPGNETELGRGLLFAAMFFSEDVMLLEESLSLSSESSLMSTMTMSGSVEVESTDRGRFPRTLRRGLGGVTRDGERDGSFSLDSSLDGSSFSWSSSDISWS